MQQQVDVQVGSEKTAVGVLWYVIDANSKKHWFTTQSLAVKWAARYRYDLMMGEAQ